MPAARSHRQRSESRRRLGPTEMPMWIMCTQPRALMPEASLCMPVVAHMHASARSSTGSHVQPARTRPQIAPACALVQKPATSASGLGSPLPHLHRNRLRPCHVCSGTALTPAGTWRQRQHSDPICRRMPLSVVSCAGVGVAGLVTVSNTALSLPSATSSRTPPHSARTYDAARRPRCCSIHHTP